MRIFLILLAGIFLSLSSNAQYCYIENGTFSSQNQIDSFQINYPECTLILGDILIQEITDGNIKNLDSLYVLTGIEGDLIISFNDSLTSLSGLDSLMEIEGLQISNNNLLTDITALTGLTELDESCIISNNGSLTNVSGLDSIQTIWGELCLMDNNSLTSLEGLGSLSYVGSDLQVGSSYPEGTPSVISSLSGLENLGLVWGDVQIINNGLLHDLTGLMSLDLLGSDLIIYKNDSLTSLNGLESLTDIDYGSLKIQMNPCLTSMEGLDILEVIYESFTCSDNINLESLDGLENLDRVHGNLVLFNNPVLSNISALSGLYYTGEIIKIVENDSLTSLEGLDNIEPGSFSLLMLSNNASLCDCSVKSVCDFLDGVNMNTNIHDNAPGCNNVEEIEAACEVGFNESAVSGQQSAVSIYPNPASTSITIEVPTATTINNTILTIYNINGQQLTTCQLTDLITAVNIGALEKGVYFVKVTNESTVLAGKFVKQ